MPRGQDISILQPVHSFPLGKAHVKPKYNQKVSKSGAYIHSRAIAATGTCLGSGPSALVIGGYYPHLSL